MTCGILFPHSGIKLAPLAVKAWSPNHWTAEKFPIELSSPGKNETLHPVNTNSPFPLSPQPLETPFYFLVV